MSDMHKKMNKRFFVVCTQCHGVAMTLDAPKIDVDDITTIQT